VSRKVVIRVLNRVFKHTHRWQTVLSWMAAVAAVLLPLLWKFVDVRLENYPQLDHYLSSYIPLILFGTPLLIALYWSEKELSEATECRINFGGFTYSARSNCYRVSILNPTPITLRNCRVKICDVSKPTAFEDLPTYLHCLHENENGPQDRCDIPGGTPVNPGEWKFDILRVEPSEVQFYGPHKLRFPIRPGQYHLRLMITADNSLPCEVEILLAVTADKQATFQEIKSTA